MKQIDIQKRIKPNIIYINYMDDTHHFYRSIVSCLSPPTPPTDPSRQGNFFRFTINRFKHLLRRLKNSACHTSRRYKEAGQCGGWEWTIPVENNNENDNHIAIVRKSC